MNNSNMRAFSYLYPTRVKFRKKPLSLPFWGDLNLRVTLRCIQNKLKFSNTREEETGNKPIF